MRRHRGRRHPIVLALTLGLVMMAGTTLADASPEATGCEAQFEIAQRTDMESFRDFDAETFRAIHHPDAITIFASGDTFVGIGEIMDVLNGFHFGPREAIWTWTEVYRVIDGCRSAFILYDTTYELPSSGFRSHALTGVAYTHQGHKWLAIADQGTPLP